MAVHILADLFVWISTVILHSPFSMLHFLNYPIAFFTHAVMSAGVR